MVWFFFMKLRRCCANSCVSATTGSWCHKHTRLSHTTLSHRHNILTHNFVTHSTSRTTLSHTQHCPGRALGDTHGMFCQMPCLEHRSPWWSRLSRFFFLLHTAFTTLCHTHTHNSLTHDHCHTQTQVCRTQLCHTTPFSHNSAHKILSVMPCICAIHTSPHTVLFTDLSSIASFCFPAFPVLFFAPIPRLLEEGLGYLSSITH